MSGATYVSHVTPSLALFKNLYAVGVALFVIGLGLRWYAIIHLGRFFTVNVAIQNDHRVVSSGPYRLVRHPSYLGALLAFLGLGVCFINLISFAIIVVPITAAFIYRIRIEESALMESLGTNYREYAARTKRLIPFIY